VSRAAWLRARPGLIRLYGSDDFPKSAKELAAEELTPAAHAGAFPAKIAEPLPLERIAEARDRPDAGNRDRVLLAIPR
jgi:NADPH2:quinone reductase